jgi:hypothetical protein
MDISSAFNSGVQGFQRATDTTDRAASDIAQATAARQGADARAETVAREEQNETTSDVESTETVNKTQSSSLTQSAVDLKAAQNQARAATEVIKTADGNLGTLLDVRA